MNAVRKRWLRAVIAALAIGTAALVIFCWYNDIWSVSEFRVYQAMSAECHPVWGDLHDRRIRLGDAAQEVMEHAPPMQVEFDGDLTVLKYHPKGLCFTGLTVVASKGRLVAAFAWSCTWVRIFFDEMEETDRNRFFEKHYDQPAMVGGATIIR